MDEWRNQKTIKAEIECLLYIYNMKQSFSFPLSLLLDLFQKKIHPPYSISLSLSQCPLFFTLTCALCYHLPLLDSLFLLSHLSFGPLYISASLVRLPFFAGLTSSEN